MKRITILAFTLMIASQFGFSQVAKWANFFTGQGFDDCNDMYVDSFGNVYVTGQIEYTVDFGPLSLSSYGSHDIFVAKYDSAGVLQWAKHAGGTDGDIGLAITVDNSGNVYITGEFEVTSTWGPITMVANGSNDLFVAKYSPSGVIQWVRSVYTNSGSSKGFGIDHDDQGNVYAAGWFTGRAYHDGSSLFSSRGSKDGIVVKFDPSGDLVWSRQIGGSDSDEALGVAVKGNDLYVTGQIEGTARFTSSSSSSQTSSGGADFFIARYDLNGNWIWADHGGGNGEDVGRDITINLNGDIVCTGEFEGNADFDNISIHANGSGGPDMFLAAYDDTGDPRWVKRAGGSASDYGRNVAHDYEGNILVGGSFDNNADFDSITISTNTNDAFIASYDSLGNIRFVRGFGGPINDRGHGVGADIYGRYYFSGEFRENIEFDSFYFSGYNLYDGFIVCFSDEPVCSLTRTESSASCFNVCDGTIHLSPTGEAPYTFDWPLIPLLNDSIATGLCTGNYPVRVTDALGCIMDDTILISQPTDLIVTASVDSATCASCNDGDIVVNVTGGTPPYSYLWNDSDTTDSRSNLLAGTYVLCVTDFNGCSECDTFIVVDATAGIFDIENNPFVTISPNPAFDHLTISLKDNVASQRLSLTLFTSTGQLVRKQDVNERQTTMELDDLAKGIYFLRIVSIDSGMILAKQPLVIFEK